MNLLRRTLPCAVAAWVGLGAELYGGEPPAPPALTNAAQLRRLPAAAAAAKLPVHVRGVVTALNPGTSVFFQDPTGGTFMTELPEGFTDLQPGEVVDIEGVSRVGLYVSGVVPGVIRRLGQAELPPPVAATYDDLVSGRLHYERVEVEGIVRSVGWHASRSCPVLVLAMGPRKLDVEVVAPGATNLPRLVDARVRLAGLAAGYINARRQLRSPELLLSRMQDLHLENPPPADPFGGPLVPATALLTFTPAGMTGHRVRVRGVVTYQQPGEALFLRDEGEGLLVQTSQKSDARPGDIVEVLGFPAMGRFSAFLEDAEFRVIGREPAPQAVAGTVEEMMRGTNHANLVSVTGTLLESMQSGNESVLLITDGITAFRARLAGSARVPRSGSVLRLTGVCQVADATLAGRRFRVEPLELELLLRSPADVTVLSEPSAWTARRLGVLVAVLVGLALAGFGYVVLLRRRVAGQTAVILDQVQREAVLEERQRMAREMHDTLAQSFSGLGFQLDALSARLPETETSARAGLETARQMVRYGREALRRSLMDLRAQELERASLSEALPELARQLTAGTGIGLHCEVQPPPRPLPELVELNLLRIGQECLANAVRHARPGTLHLSLAHEPGRVRLRIADDGAGFDPARLPQNGSDHFGWRGIRERAGRINAQLEIESRPGRGTTVTVTVPLSA